MDNKWKNLAGIINAPYDKKFYTTNKKNFIITSKGLYSFEHKKYDNGELLILLLNRKLKVDKKSKITKKPFYSLHRRERKEILEKIFKEIEKSNLNETFLDEELREIRGRGKFE